MTQISYFWDGDSVGDATPMTDDLLALMLSILFQKTPSTEAVLSNQRNEFSTAQDADDQTKINVSSGCALVNGTFYDLSEQKTFEIEAPASGSYYYGIKLSKIISSQTVRLICEGPTTSPPTNTQNASLYEVFIAYIEVTSAWVVTITDQRDFCTFRSAISA